MYVKVLQNNTVDDQYKEGVLTSLYALAERLNNESEHDSMIVLEAIVLITENCDDAHKKLAHYYYRKSNWNRAIQHFEKYCMTNRVDFISMFYLANAYKSIGRHDDAIDLYKQSIDIHEYPEGLMNLSSVYVDINDRARQLEVLEVLTSKFPEYTLGYYNLGVYWYGEKDLDKAIAYYRRALETNPGHGESKIALALALLMDKQYFEGFQMYENRWGVWPNCPIREFNRPCWKGESVREKSSILISFEQGFGDTIMMARYIPQVLEVFDYVWIEVQPAMQRLISKAFPKIQTVVRGNALPMTDYYCPIMSMPFAFRTGETAIPNKRRYITVEDFEPFFESMILGQKQRVGICWRCGGHDLRTAHRSLSFDLIKDLFSDDNYTWVSLTKDLPPDEIYSVANTKNLENWMGEIEDFYDTYRLIESLDLVITVDTAIAHLAGAMGKPTIVILNEGYDWKWTVSDQYSAWYPLTRLFRAYRLSGGDGLVPALFLQIKEIFG